MLSRLLFGTSPSNLSATEAIQLAAALNSLRGSGGGGLNPIGKLRSATGFDRLRLVGADQATGRGTSLAAGKYLTDNIYVENHHGCEGRDRDADRDRADQGAQSVVVDQLVRRSAASLKYSKD